MARGGFAAMILNCSIRFCDDVGQDGILRADCKSAFRDALLQLGRGVDHRFSCRWKRTDDKKRSSIPLKPSVHSRIVAARKEPKNQ
jgi:hypothetical protein